MVKIECIIKPSRMDDLREALIEHGITGMTAWEVKGFGRQKGHKELYRGSEYQVEFIPKIMVMIVVEESRAEEVVSKIQEATRTGTSGSIGDGKIFVSPIKDTVRIRTGETGPDAV